MTPTPTPFKRFVELKPIKESTEDYEALEKRIKELFKRLVYFPILAALDPPEKVTLSNAKDGNALLDALRAGRITFNRGTFSGRFNAGSSKELKRLGAKWDRKTGTFKLSQSSLPYEMRSEIAASDKRFQDKIAGIDRQLAQILPEKIAGHFKGADLFDRTIYKTESEFQRSVANLVLAPKLTPEARKRIADEWEFNLKLYIKDFEKEEIERLRREMKKSVFTGNRYESAVTAIQKSYEVSANKAKFLARQETSLLMTKLKETRYQDAGVDMYRWGIVTGSKDHPVRPTHKALDGKYFRWDDPREVDKHGIFKPNGARKPGNNLNPGQDYNCRCFARPIVRF